MDFSTTIYGGSSAFSQILGVAVLINGQHVGGTIAIVVAMAIVVIWGAVPKTEA